MVKELREHQQKIIDDDPERTGIWYGCGGGNTLTALHLAKGRILVVCPKVVRDEQVWEKEAEGTLPLTVISKEEFKRDIDTLIKQEWDTLIVDEADKMLGVTPNIRWRNKKPIPKTSQLYEALEAFVKVVNPKRLYLLTATITRSPMCIYGAGRILGRNWDFYKFRDAFYFKLPMPGRVEIFAPKRDKKTNERLARVVHQLGYVGTLADWFDVPDHIHKTHNVSLTDEQREAMHGIDNIFADPLIARLKEHQIENGILCGDEFARPQRFKTKKHDIILDYVYQFNKVLIFAKYTEQIEAIRELIKKENIPVFVLNGQTKNKGGVTTEAEALDKCVVIAQSQISAGYELPSFPCTIFASFSWSFVDYEQALGRTLRMNNIKKNCYVNIVCDGVDTDVYKTLQDKKDFHLEVYERK